MSNSQVPLTFMFTDLEGSTRLHEEAPQQMLAALDQHDIIVVRCLTEHGGTQVKPRGEGDSVFATFTSPIGAVRAAVALVRSLANHPWTTPRPLTPRVSIHTGPATLREQDFYGPTVNRAARIRAIAHGGQIVVSGATRALIEDHSLAEITLIDLGEHILKDLERPEQIFQVTAPGLVDEFPALRSMRLEKSNIPIAETALIGRSREIAELSQLLQTNRVVSLVGLGGIGKSRLALAVGDRLRRVFADGVWHVDLADSGDSGIAEMVSVVTGLEIDGPDAVNSLVAGSKDRELLLILDHGDQRLPQASAFVRSLATGTKNVRVLVTSQAPLNLPNESVYPVRELSLPAPDAVKDADVLNCDSARLFVERARLRKPDFAVGPSHVGALKTLLQLIGGMPISIELVASRVRVLSLPELVRRVQADFSIAGDGPDGPVGKVIQSAVAQLSPQCLTLYARTAVFAGCFELDALELIAADESIPQNNIWQLLETLVDVNLVQEDEGAFRLLGPVRRDAARRAAEMGILPEMRTRHAKHYAKAVIEIANESVDSDFQAYLQRVSLNLDNVRAAIQYSLEFDPGIALAVVPALFRFWEAVGFHREGWAIAEAVANAIDPANPSKELGDTLNAAACLAARAGAYETGRALHERARIVRSAIGDERGLAGTLNNLANIENELGELSTAFELYRQALVLNQRLDNRVFQGINLVNLGTIAHRQRRHSDAVDFHRQSLAAFTELGKKPMTIYPLASMGNALVALGEFAQADDVFRRALKLCEENGDVPWTIVCLEGLAAVALGVGDGPNFGRRLGLGMQLRSQIGLPLSPSDAEEQAQFVHEAYGRFGQDAVLQWKAEGRELGVNDVVGPRGN